MGKLGIIGAMEEEIETLLGALSDKKSFERADSIFWTGKLNGLDTVIVRCGVGKVNAACCAQQMCGEFGISYLVNTGIAGSLSADLDIGDLVVSSDAMYHDFDCTHFGYAFGQVPGTASAAFPADEKLMAYAFTAAEEIFPGRCRIGRIASGDQFISTPEIKTKIICTTHALCTEMEGAAIAQTATRCGVPYVILRAISDKADDSASMDYPAFEKMAAHRCAAVTRKLASMLFADEQETT